MTLSVKIKSIVGPPLQHLGFKVVQIKFIEAEKSKLEILIERLDLQPVTVEDCMRANRTISTHLDVEDLIHKAYMLEVSSAGIDRPLVDIEDYARFVGYKALIQTSIGISGAKKFKGFLEKVTETHVWMRSESPQLEEVIEIPFVDILKGKLDLDYMIELKLRERKEQK
ncbi:MAG: ribosome maturation factor RimP [Candidatus Paracaedibacteraceae bacterium]|nr:ribosome maturation factor RimP [Candidatus Paracaedibacteraceae bacterium]